MLMLLLTLCVFCFEEVCKPRLNAANEAEPYGFRIHIWKQFRVTKSMLSYGVLVKDSKWS
jgi:hypothetical protein